MRKASMLRRKLYLLSMTCAIGLSLAACQVSVVENDDGTIDIIVESCLLGTFEGDANYSISTRSGDSEPFDVESTSRHAITFGDDFKPMSFPLMLGQLSTAQPDDLTDMPEIDFFENSGTQNFSWVTRETIGEGFRDVRTDATFEINSALFEKTRFRIDYDFVGQQFFFNEIEDNPQNDDDADSSVTFSGNYVLEGELSDPNTLNCSSSTDQTVIDDEFGVDETIDGTGTGQFQLVVRNEF